MPTTRSGTTSRSTRDRREQFRELLARYAARGVLDDHLNEVELRNLRHFGYGVKGFVLSMIETAIETDPRPASKAGDVSTIIDWGREMLASPTELLDGVSEAIESLGEQYPLILVTKGDLLDQQSKLARSGLAHPLQRDRNRLREGRRDVYRASWLATRSSRARFVMVGNSLRSDILPAIEAGAHAVYVPYEVSWIHERVSAEALANVHYPRDRSHA